MKLTKYVRQSGCSTKIPALRLTRILRKYGIFFDNGTYEISKKQVIVQTADIYYPMVDDPYTFGQIAAAGSLNSMYSMGVKPVTVLNISGFPVKKLPREELSLILKGGCDKLMEAKVSLIGGHSMEDPETKCGYVMFGVASKNEIMTIANAKPKDKLILTKPLGTGAICAAIKQGKASRKSIDEISKSMVCLNNKVLDIMREVGVSVCSNIGNFGLVGHGYEMASSSKVGIIINSADVPVFNKAIDYIKDGIFPPEADDNKKFAWKNLQIDYNVSNDVVRLLSDPQISGGVLISASPYKSDILLNKLHKAKISSACIIGEVIAGHEGKVFIE